MPNFKKLYEKSQTVPSSTIYFDKKIWSLDRFLVSNEDILIINIEKTNSQFRQGFCIGVEGVIKFLDKKYSKGKSIDFFLWERKEPYEVQIFTESLYIYVQNAWYDPAEGEKAPACYVGGREWLLHDHWGGAGMIVEEIENGKRYYCNDGECDDDFDDIIFTVTRKPYKIST
ncbi:MAG: hypothetical protein S4CHLAM6_09550 [Chlamydiae bacterium]|nr:hypothetical protein [Chlamydiota bacterium]